MRPGDYDISNDYVPRLKADLEKTLLDYQKATTLRAKRMEQDMEQIKVYLDILENRPEFLNLSSSATKKLHDVLSWKPKSTRKNSTHRKQQDQLEEHFLELQKVLVGLISKRFKY
jgi:hypothetical protein